MEKKEKMPDMSKNKDLGSILAENRLSAAELKKTSKNALVINAIASLRRAGV